MASSERKPGLPSAPSLWYDPVSDWVPVEVWRRLLAEDAARRAKVQQAWAQLERPEAER